MGFEAASNGAATVTFVEPAKSAAQALSANIRMLGAQNCQVINTSAEQFTESATGPYDIIFLDPPYEKPELLEHVLGKLCEHAMIKDYVYLEALNEDMLLELCGRFNLAPQRTTHAGATHSVLASI